MKREVLQKATKEPRFPKAGEGWRHFKGHLYYIVGLAINSTHGTWDVVYTDMDTGQLFTRDISEFLQSVNNSAGEKVQRFVYDGD